MTKTKLRARMWVQLNGWQIHWPQKNAKIVSIDPSGRRHGVCSSLICFLPMAANYLISPIDASREDDIIYSTTGDTK